MSSSPPACAVRVMAAGPPTSLLPIRIDQRYEVLEQLGRGGMAVVYRVRDLGRKEPLALKQLALAGSNKDRELRALFEREYHVLAQLSHPSVVQVHDFGVELAGPYYTMELLDSGDISSWSPWPVDNACQLMMQVCSALSLLHSRRLVHRDISPRNVRCTQNGVAKLIDFGAMVPMGPCMQVVGTPGFVAPEVVHQRGLDARADLFSLGATLYYALTGHRPFAARSLSDLADLWRHEPKPPSELVPEIPTALDHLVMSLLHVDPARRPNSAFEVMQRLAAIAGTPLMESAEISHAYLSTPTLVGRDTHYRRFRQSLTRALHAAGGGLLFQGASGTGRSRLLDTCVLEAKTSGAAVLRATGRAARPQALACAHDLALQLMAAVPEQAATCAADVGALDTLFVAPIPSDSDPLPRALHLRPVEAIAEDIYAARSALQAWLQRVAETRTLVIAIDDIERIDEASLAWLVALVDRGSGTRLLLVSTTLSPIDADLRPALGVLQTRCLTVTLEAFTALETNALFASVFRDAPSAPLVSDRIHKLAAGNARDTLALAKHMLARHVIRYADGNWILPDELAVDDLPANIEEALKTQLASLPAVARRLAECQAIALEGPWSRSDYYALASEAGEPRVAEAIDTLLQQGVIVQSAGAYTLSHLAVRRSLVSQLSSSTRLQHQQKLAQLCAHTERHGLVEVYHLLQAEEFGRGVERLAQVVETAPTLTLLYRQSGVDFTIVVNIIEQARSLGVSHGRSAREICELTRLLLELSVSTDTALYYRYAAAWLAQLEQDTGLANYRADQRASAEDRLQRAIQATMTRYTNTPPMQRVYRVDDAIKNLAHYVAVSIVVGSRTMDASLLASLPGLLEPFSILSPMLYALWQNAFVAHEIHCTGQYEQAHKRTLDVYQRLESVSRQDMPYLDAVRAAIAHAAAYTELVLGYPGVERWIALAEVDPLQRVSARQLRQAVYLIDGDLEAAERCRREAEVLAVQSHTRQMFEPAMLYLYIHRQRGDLTAVKHAVDRVAGISSQWPGWCALLHVAQATFQHMRGDLQAAKQAYERALEESDPDRTDRPPLARAWISAAIGYVMLLVELGELEQAITFGQRVCDRCDAQGISSEGYAQVRALAWAEAKSGQHASAIARMDRLIAQRANLRPSVLAIDLEARARIAIVAKDAAGAVHFAQLALQGTATDDRARFVQYGRLLDEAREAGLNMPDTPCQFETRALGRSESNHIAATRAAALTKLHEIERFAEPKERAHQVLAQLAAAAGASAGHLYYMQPPNLMRVAELATPPDPELDRFAGEFLAQWLEQIAMTSVFTDLISSAEPELATWFGDSGTVYRITPLIGKLGGSCIGLIAFHDAPDVALSPEYRALAANIGQRLLELGDTQAATAR